MGGIFLSGEYSACELKSTSHSSVMAFRVAEWFKNERRCPSTSQIYYLRAAKAGYSPAMIRLASICFSAPPRGEIRDVEKMTAGVKWLKEASNAGNSTADYLLARCYADGIGVKEDRSMAIYYLKKSSSCESCVGAYRPMEALVFGSLSRSLKDLALGITQRAKSTGDFR